MSVRFACPVRGGTLSSNSGQPPPAAPCGWPPTAGSRQHFLNSAAPTLRIPLPSLSRGFPRSGTLALVCFVAGCAHNDAVSDPYDLQGRVDAFIAENPEIPGAAVIIVDSNGMEISSGASGVAWRGEGGTPSLTVNTPVRIASNTKTYVAATLLRLWESDRIDIDAPISRYTDASLRALLEVDGYPVSTISVRQVMAHSAGFFDHAQTDDYFEMIMADPEKVWTREEQIALAVRLGDPVAAPGEEFRYSDTGYLVLGHIIERVTGTSLAEAVRTELGIDRLGLTHTWWEIVETPPDAAPARAHQYSGGTDTHDWHGSIDLYGGGGIVTSMRDLAAFNAALFRGDVFERPETLAEMTSPEGPADPASYRLGLQFGEVSGQPTIGHSGFWGTVVYHFPELGVTMAAVTTERSGMRPLRAMLASVAEEFGAVGVQ